MDSLCVRLTLMEESAMRELEIGEIEMISGGSVTARDDGNSWLRQYWSKRLDGPRWPRQTDPIVL